MEGYSHLGSLLLKHEVDGKIITDLDEMLSSLSSLAGYHLHYHTDVGVGLCLGKLLFTTILASPLSKFLFQKSQSFTHPIDRCDKHGFRLGLVERRL
ncbi:hypothetical protein [Peribacillus simplex]|uniref:Uncharacterized protein n=1 Tax=Peribacillus simplex TaxID=1478 RepID=A0AAW7IU55_9BACI|nr:hypothetical protein [Peribacillus simplex]MDM5454926.1 hypothetical protein [Peribacillus simplex]